MVPTMLRIRAGMTASLASASLFVATVPALAAGSNMPWEQPLNQILQSIEGPVTKVIAVLVIIMTGLSLAFGDGGGGFRPCSVCRSRSRLRPSSCRSSRSAAER